VSIWGRISYDTATFSKYGFRPRDILQRIWNRIKGNDYRNEMISIMIHDLINERDTCSSGLISRIVNTLSGFTTDTIILRVSFKEQIIANIEGRLNSYIRDSDIQDTLLIGITECGLLENGYSSPPMSEYFMERNVFVDWIFGIIPDLYKELWEEFKEYTKEENVLNGTYCAPSMEHYIESEKEFISIFNEGISNYTKIPKISIDQRHYLNVCNKIHKQCRYIGLWFYHTLQSLRIIKTIKID
jgi:hypothetical protein